MRGIPYGQTPADHVAFAISHPARRFALLQAARVGRVTALDIQREFTDYNRHAAHDLLYVLRDRGLLERGPYIPDIQGKMRQATYVLTSKARKGVRDLLELVTELHKKAN